MNKGKLRMISQKKDKPTFEERVQQEVRRILRQKVDAIIGETIGNTLAATAVVLHEEYGMDRKRILNFVGAYNKVFEDAVNGKGRWSEILAMAEKLGVGGVKENTPEEETDAEEN